MSNHSSSRSAADPTSAAEQLAAMAAELQQRDQLIEVLTERLEEAAEQLDRIHRSGGDRGVRGGGGGAAMPAEALEYLYSVAERTDQMVGEWTELEAAQLLSRLDARIEKLIDLMRGDTPAESQPYTPPSFIPQEPGTGAPACEHSHPGPNASDNESAPVEDDTPIELKDPPAAISDDETDSAKLHAAIRDREDYISYLIREVRRRHPRKPIDWESLQAVPEKLTARLKSLEDRLQSEVQREELALSIERAKLSRERNELEKIRSRLEKEIRSLGKSAGKEANTGSGQPVEDSGGGLRRLFGRK